MSILILSAVSIAFVHTVIGPDHYLPFIMIAKARNWSISRTLGITFVCGVGHVLSSVILGLIGIAFGIALSRLEFIESFRGNIAAYLLIGFGFIYFIWGLKQAFKNKPHSHFHIHGDGKAHIHTHTHVGNHTHIHADETKSITPWVLFLIFVFGPCEPLIPLLMYPAAKSHWMDLTMVTIAFSIVTIGTMMVIVFLASKGLHLLTSSKIERYTHAIAGFTIFLCGMGIQFLGL